MNATQLFKQILQTIPPAQVAHALGLHPNTVRRWGDEQKVPEHYAGDFRRMLGETGFADDQFYTRKDVARQCYREFLQVAEDLKVNIRRYTFIEPSAGCGHFYRALPRTRRIGIDLHPRHDGIIKDDYLLWKPNQEGNYIVIGNPPFGLRGHLALQFVNHSADFADMVAFILPQLFESDGKGAPSKRVDKRMRLAHSRRLDADSFARPDGEPVEISTIFQVWTKINHEHVRLQPRKTCRQFMRIYSLSDGGTPASTRNKDMIGKCDLYLPSTCFTGMKAYGRFEDLPNRRGYGVVVHQRKRAILSILESHDWPTTAFQSTNGALNLRRSLIEDVVAEQGHYDNALPL